VQSAIDAFRPILHSFASYISSRITIRDFDQRYMTETMYDTAQTALPVRFTIGASKA